MNRTLAGYALRMLGAPMPASWSPGWAVGAGCRLAAATGTYRAAASVSNDNAATSTGMQRVWDKMHLKGLVFHGYHGAIPEENVLGQKFIVNATLYCDLREAGSSDKLNTTVNYAEVYTQIKEIMEAPPSQLLEHIADKITVEVMQAHPRVEGITLEIQKPHVAVPGVVGSLGIEITRFKGPAP